MASSINCSAIRASGLRAPSCGANFGEDQNCVEGCGEYMVEIRENGQMVKKRDEIVGLGMDEILPCKSAKKAL